MPPRSRAGKVRIALRGISLLVHLCLAKCKWVAAIYYGLGRSAGVPGVNYFERRVVVRQPEGSLCSDCTANSKRAIERSSPVCSLRGPVSSCAATDGMAQLADVPLVPGSSGCKLCPDLLSALSAFRQRFKAPMQKTALSGPYWKPPPN